MRGANRRPLARPASLLFIAALVTSCTPVQEGAPLVDVEPEKLVNTELACPKNPQRWSYVSSRVAFGPGEPFPGFQVVLVNPFAARSFEANRHFERGTKLIQLVHAPRNSATGVQPGELLRVNLMVQDAEKYAASGGWGYASFDAAGNPLPIDVRTDCLRCHTAGPLSAAVLLRGGSR
jgi:hypothetical protein